MAICIPKEFIEDVKKIVSIQDSAKRLDAFKQFFGGDLAKAQEMNLAFEKTLLLKKQELALRNFIDKFTELGVEKRASLKARLAENMARKNDILSKEELLSIVKDTIDKRYKIDVSPNDVVQIAKLKAEANKLRPQAFATPEGSPERMAYGRAMVDVADYIDGIVNPFNKMNFSETLKNIFRESYDKIFARPTAPGKVLETLSQGIELATSPVYKSIQASLDASFVLKQGLKVFATDPKTWLDSVNKSFGILLKPGSKEVIDLAAREAKAQLISSDLYEAAVKAKLPINVIEDYFPTPLGEKIPIIGSLFKRSDVAFSTFSNNARMSLFENMYRKFIDINGTTPTDEIAKEMAEVASSITGRGKLGKLESVSGILNKMVFSARYVKSSLDTFIMPFRKDLDPIVRKQAIDSLRNTLALSTAIMSTAALFTEVEFDPRSSKFGKIKVPGSKDTWIDVTGGLGSYITLASRSAIGLGAGKPFGISNKEAVKSATTGKLNGINTGEYGNRTVFDLLSDFTTNKLAPAPSALVQYAKGKNFKGEQPTLESSIQDILTPISLGNAWERMLSDEDASVKFFGTIADMLGSSATDYTQFKK